MNKAMSGKDLLDMVEVLAHEKSVDIDVVFGVVEVALATAIKRLDFPGRGCGCGGAYRPRNGRLFR